MRRFIAAMSYCALLFGFVSIASAELIDRHGPQTGAGVQASGESRIVTRTVKRKGGKVRVVAASRYAVAIEGHGVIGGRPAGCPHRFCGCALSIKLFGRIIPQLNLAANWKSFPQVAPAPGMVAARFGHVFQLVSHAAGNLWTVWDANSGGGRIRIHARSIAGYTIHNPNGSLAAVNHKRRFARHAKRMRYARAG